MAGGGYNADKWDGAIYHERLFIFEFDAAGRFKTTRPDRQFAAALRLNHPDLQPLADVSAIVSWPAPEPTGDKHSPSRMTAGFQFLFARLCLENQQTRTHP